MTELRRVQLRFVVFMAVATVLLAVPVIALTEPAGNDVTNRAITRTAKLPVILWCFGWLIACPQPSTGLRFTWSLGCVLCLLHIAVAFHLGHGWSHQAAWEHTRQVGGYGDGIYVNYAFAIVWLADVFWAWVAFDSYRARPRWLNWTVHGFLAFVVVNAAFVFGSWESRIRFCIFFFGMLVLVAYFSRRKPTNGGVNPFA